MMYCQISMEKATFGTAKGAADLGTILWKLFGVFIKERASKTNNLVPNEIKGFSMKLKVAKFHRGESWGQNRISS